MVQSRRGLEAADRLRQDRLRGEGLELIQEQVPTDAKLVAQCLYDRVDLGNQVPAVTDALEALRRRSASSAGEEWERERRDVTTPRDTVRDLAKGELEYLIAEPDRPKLQARTACSTQS